MKWIRKNGEVIKIDDYDFFKFGSWVPNALKLYLLKHYPDLVDEYIEDEEERIENQPDYDILIKNTVSEKL